MLPSDRLLWVETTDSGVFTFRLEHGATEIFWTHSEMTRTLPEGRKGLAERPAEELDPAELPTGPR
jgi:hypothetical protein